MYSPVNERVPMIAMESYSQPVRAIFSIGTLKEYEWPDYTIYGINTTHKDELLQLATDEQHLDSEDDDGWAPMHAFRALLPMADKRVANAFAKLVAERDEDEFIDRFLHPVIFRMMPDIWGSLLSQLEDKETSEFGKISLIHLMKNIAQEHPEHRTLAVQTFCQQLDADNHEPSPNAFLISGLLDLEAEEAMESITAVFKRDAVDCSIIGDLEDVEIALGLRQERETPARDYLVDMFPGIGLLREKLAGYSDEEKIELVARAMGLAERPEEERERKYSPPARSEKIGRNDPCPCGSGKKYKKCCMN